MAASLFSTLGSSRQNGLARFFEWAPAWIDVADPGGQSGALSGYLTWTGRQEVVESLHTAAERASKALTAEAGGDHEEAKRLWRIILGSAFPS